MPSCTMLVLWCDGVVLSAFNRIALILRLSTKEMDCHLNFVVFECQCSERRERKRTNIQWSNNISIYCYYCCCCFVVLAVMNVTHMFFYRMHLQMRARLNGKWIRFQSHSLVKSRLWRQIGIIIKKRRRVIRCRLLQNCFQYMLSAILWTIKQ